MWAPKFFFEGFISRCYTLSQAIILCNLKENVWSKLNKMVKNLILAWFRPIGPDLRLPIFFFQKFVFVSHWILWSAKLMIQSWQNLVTDGRINASDFIGRCPTNVERPKEIWFGSNQHTAKGKNQHKKNISK